MTLSTEGFERPRLPEIKSDYDQRFTDALGPVNTGADSVVGQIIAIFSAALDDAYEVLQDTYDSMYPSSAEGISLDGAVSFIGLERLAAEPTTVYAMCYGTEGTLIPAGALARADDNSQYEASESVVIGRANAGDIYVSVLSVQNSVTYQLIVGGTSFTYDSDVDATAEEIIAGLAAAFAASNFTATIIGTTQLRITAVDLYSKFTVTIGPKLKLDAIGSPVLFTALESGAAELPAGALTTIDTALLGWTSIENLVAGDIGRAVETDDELRIRHAESVRVTGAATLKAIRSRLLAEVDSVNYVAIYENRTNEPDIYGLPAHSFEAVVIGGLDQAVADKIFEVKPAGIETHGNTFATVIDDNGDGQTMYFSRPTTKYAWIKVTVDSLYTEEALAPTTEQAIKDAVLAQGASLNIGEDIILQRFIGPIYEAVRGLGGITIEADLTALPGDTPTYGAVNIAVARTEQSEFDLTRISVVGLP